MFLVNRMCCYKIHIVGSTYSYYFFYYQGELYKPVKVDDCFWSIGKSLGFRLSACLDALFCMAESVAAEQAYELAFL
jgi:hypothetical protein